MTQRHTEQAEIRLFPPALAYCGLKDSSSHVLDCDVHDHDLRLRMYDLSNPLLNYLIAFSTSRLRSLLAQLIISSSVITSSSSAYWIMFLDTIWPTSVDLSRKGRSHSSYRSKSTVVPSGCRSRVKVDAGQMVRLRFIMLGGWLARRESADISARNCLRRGLEPR